MDKAKIAIVLGLLALLTAGVGFFNPKTIVEKVDLSEVFEKIEQTVKKLGAQTGPTLTTDNGCLDINGLVQCSGSRVFSVSTSTVCAFDLWGSPTRSTSTILMSTAGIYTSTGTAQVFQWGVSDNYDATTTAITTFPLAADTQGTSLVIGTSTGTTVDTAFTTQLRYLNLKYGGSACTNGSKCHSFNDVASSTCKVTYIKHMR